MGFLSFIKNATRSSRTINLDASLGNVLISGSSKRGAECVIRNFAIDSCNRGYGMVIFRNHTTGISTYPSIASSGRLIYSIDCTDNSTTDQIDVFSGMSDNDVNSYIIKLFDMYSEIDKSKKMSFQNYIALLRSLTKKAGKKIKLNEFSDCPIEELETINMTYCTGVEQSRNDRFLSSIRSEIRELESYFYDFSNNVAGYVLSGNKTLEQIFKLKPLVEISLDFAGRPEESKIIMTAIIDAIGRFNLGSSSVKSVNVVVDGAPNDILINSGLQKLIKGGRGFNTVYTVQDISNLVEESNEWVDNADSYFFFQQNSNDNKEYCSQFFGEHEVEKQSVTKGSSHGTLWGALFGNSAPTTNNDSVTRTKVKERIYPPEIFSGLPDNIAIYYDKRTNEYVQLTVF